MSIINVMFEEHLSDDIQKNVNFLSFDGIDHGLFLFPKFAENMSKYLVLNAQQREELILSFPKEIDRFSSCEGYRADVVCFYPEMPERQEIVNKFGSIHFHFENEYWYFVDGEAVFGFLGKDGIKYEITVQSGEYLKVPQGCWQWFRLTDINLMKSIRFFYSDSSPKLAQRVF
jgi:1,2-dihydroxy-3-keto-5-methylthiopentene dioxygenase